MEPMNAALKTAKPGERTQLGSAICAATRSEDRIVIQPTPATTMASARSHSLSRQDKASIASA